MQYIDFYSLSCAFVLVLYCIDTDNMQGHGKTQYTYMQYLKKPRIQIRCGHNTQTHTELYKEIG